MTAPPGHRQHVCANPARAKEIPDMVIHLDCLLTERGMTMATLSELTGLTPVNLSRLRNGRVSAVWLSTLSAVCQALDCQPGDVITREPADDQHHA